MPCDLKEHYSEKLNLHREYLAGNHFGFQVTGAHFIDFASIRLEPDERPEDLFQRLMAFVEDSLLKDEEMSPSLENFVVLEWLRLINPELPKLVKQGYGT